MSRRLTDAQRAQRDLIERDFQKAYVAALRNLGFFVGHHYDSRFSDPGTKGLPDLQIVGHGMFWCDELKREAGVVSDEQLAWHRQLEAAGVVVFVHRPSDWENMMLYAETIAGRAVEPKLRSHPLPKKKKPKAKRQPLP